MNNKNFNIPIPLIVLAYILYWPAGIVLTILRALVSKGKIGQGEDKKTTTFDFSNKASWNTNQTAQQKTQQTYQQTAQPKAQQTARTGSAAGSSPAAQGPEARPAKETIRSKVRRGSTEYRATLIIGIAASFIAAFWWFGALFMGGDSTMMAVALGALNSIVAAGSFIASIFFNKRDIRFARIKTMIGDRESVNLTKLAAASNESVKQIRRDVQKLIDKGEFGETAYIDLGKNNFMRSPDAKPDDSKPVDYRQLYGDLFGKDQDASKADDKDNFITILTKIRELNDEIADVEVSERIDKIEEHTRNIFDYVLNHPEAMPEIRTFMNYYLPTTLKLLESYSRIERVGVAGENMKKSKKDIEDILDMLVTGFEQQVDQLFRSESIDITSDIKVLEQMMQKDGLSGKSDFDLTGRGKPGAGGKKKKTQDDSVDLGGAAAMAQEEEK